jgi:hypothetical protein
MMMRRRKLIDPENGLAPLGQLINGRTSHRTQTNHNRVEFALDAYIQILANPQAFALSEFRPVESCCRSAIV